MLNYTVIFRIPAELLYDVVRVCVYLMTARHVIGAETLSSYDDRLRLGVH